jgi:hypothetical protein
LAGKIIGQLERKIELARLDGVSGQNRILHHYHFLKIITKWNALNELEKYEFIK